MEQTQAVKIIGRDVSLPRRAAQTHKGDYGRVLVLGGSVGYTGAPTLCAKGALRAGAGLVYLGVPQDIYTITAVKNDEAMPFCLEDEALLAQRLSACDVCVVGPGLGRGLTAAALTRRALTQAKRAVVLDADALWAASREPDMLKTSQAAVIVTPHEGEFAWLFPEKTGDRERDALACADKYGCITVLKGHRTLCAFPDGALFSIEAGNPGMAKGGTGDVLAGVLGGMLGQFAPDKGTILTALWLHARAGDIAAQIYGEYYMTASNLLGALSKAELEIQE